MTSVLKKSRGTKGKSESMQEDLPSRWTASRGLREDTGKLIKYIDDSIIGKGNSFCGPFGRRKANYIMLEVGQIEQRLTNGLFGSRHKNIAIGCN